MKYFWLFVLGIVVTLVVLAVEPVRKAYVGLLEGIGLATPDNGNGGDTGHVFKRFRLVNGEKNRQIKRIWLRGGTGATANIPLFPDDKDLDVDGKALYFRPSVSSTTQQDPQDIKTVQVKIDLTGNDMPDITTPHLTISGSQGVLDNYCVVMHEAANNTIILEHHLFWYMNSTEYTHFDHADHITDTFTFSGGAWSHTSRTEEVPAP